MALLRTPLAACLAAALLGGAPGPAAGQLFLTQEEALELAFGVDATVERRTAYLSEEQVARIESLDGSDGELDERVVTHYVATRAGKPVGVAYFDAHRVRTLPEVLMVAVEPGGQVARVEVLKFSEPPDYLAPAGWLDQFDGRSLDDELAVERGIVNMTGATLTSRAVTRAVRRVLALHRVIDPLGES